METISPVNNFSAWKFFWSKKNFRIQFFISVSILLFFMFIFPYFFDFVESRTGQVLNDPFLNYLPATDVSWFIFSILYFTILSWVISSVKSPDVLLRGIETYILVTTLRMCSITLFPLEAPLNYIPLREPFVQFFTNGGKIISKDLFFSGHMATILFCYYTTRKGTLKKIYLAAAIIIGLLLMVQRVHYTIDIITAPLFTWLCYVFVRKVLTRKI
ncbi:MAG: hypothetical protein JJE25_04390 [Bacteroidia bacterium]|nr:hypothetical protein [Bacteroidia bacterium]